MKKVYLAGPTCFSPLAESLYSRYADLLEKSGYLAIIPSDGGLSKGERPSPILAAKIFNENIIKIKSANYVIADLTSFRGAESDSGTCFEVGFAFAFEIPVIGWSSDRVTVTDKLDGLTLPENKLTEVPAYADTVRLAGFYPRDTELGLVDKNGDIVENMGLPFNLMIGKSVNQVVDSFESAVIALNRLA